MKWRARDIVGSDQWANDSDYLVDGDEATAATTATDGDILEVMAVEYQADGLESHEELLDAPDSVHSLYGANWEAQTFLTVSAYTISGVRLRLSRTLDAGVLTVGLYATSSGLPTGSALASGTLNLDIDVMPNLTYGYWIPVSFSSGYALSDATTYAIVVSAASGDASNYVDWACDSTAGYASGQRCYSSNSGSSWDADSSDDFPFQCMADVQPGYITKVECRWLRQAGDADDYLGGTPYFGGIAGGTVYQEQPGTSKAWCTWQDITEDAAGPHNNSFINHNDSGGNFRIDNTNDQVGQQFLMDSEPYRRCAGAGTYMFASGSPSGTLYMGVYAQDGSGHPTGSVLGQGSVAISSGWSNTQVIVEFVTPFFLSPDTDYVLVWWATGTLDATNYIEVRANQSTGSYADGIALTSDDGGSSWNNQTLADCTFTARDSWVWTDIEILNYYFTYDKTGKGNTMSLFEAELRVTYTPSPSTVSMSVAALTASAQTLTVVLAAGVTVNMLVAALTASAQGLTVVPGAVSPNMNPAVIAATAQALTLIPGAVTAAAAQALTVSPGPVTLSMVEAALNAAAQALTVSVGAVTLPMSEIAIAATAQALSLVPGAVSLSMSEIGLTASAESLTVAVVTRVAMLVAALTASAQALDVVPGAASVTMNVTTLNALAAALQVVPGAVTLSMSEAVLAAAAQALTVVPVTTLSMFVVDLVAAAQNLSVVPGAVSLGMNEVSLSAAAQLLTVATGAVTLGMSEVALTAAAQALSLLPGAVTLGMSEISLSALAQSMSVSAGTIISMLEVALAASAQGLTVVPGAVSLGMSPAVLAATAPSLTLVPGQTIRSMGVIQLAVVAQALTVVHGAVSLGMSAVELSAVAQVLSVISGGLIQMQVVGLTAAPQALSLVPGAVSLGMNPAALSALAQALTLVPGAVSPLMNPIALSALAQTLSLVPGSVSLGMNPVILNALAQTLTVDVWPLLPRVCLLCLALCRLVWMQLVSRLSPSRSV
jgi:hypothetical protein